MSHEFFVLCQGYSGSHFLANSLSLHPDILCTHGHDHPLTTLPLFFEDVERFEQLLERCLRGNLVNDHYFNIGLNKDVCRSYIDTYKQVCKSAFQEFGPSFIHRWSPQAFLGLEFTLPYLKLLGVDTQNIAEMQFGEKDMVNYNKVLAEFVDGVIKYKFIGNVHGYNLKIYLLAKKRWPSWAKSIRVINLVRHPVTRYMSFIRRVSHEYYHRSRFFADQLERFVLEHKEDIKHIERQYYLDFSVLENRIIYFDVNHLHVNKHWAEEFEFAKRETIWNVYFERLIKEPDYFKSIVQFLTQSQIDVPQHYLDLVFSPENALRGRQTSRTSQGNCSPDQTWERLNPWIQEQIKKEFQEYQVIKKYLESPYTFQFMHRKS